MVKGWNEKGAEKEIKLHLSIRGLDVNFAPMSR